MFKKKKNSHVSIEINDYVLRALVSKGPDLFQAEVFEVALPHEIIDEATLKDEMALFEIFKENATKWGGKKQNVRFFVPDPTVLLKSFEHPRDVEPDKLKEYVQMELGHSIHLPFQDSLIDVYDPVAGDGQAMMFAAASEEINKYINLFLDIHMEPQAADIRALCNLRLLENMQMIDNEKTYLIANWLINELSICIYSNGHVDFLRYQQIPTAISQWHSKSIMENELEFTYDGDMEDYRMTIIDQVLELERIMNFFRFSLHKGEKSVDEIIIMGDSPLLGNIHHYLQDTLPVTAKLVDDSLIDKHFPGFKAKHASLLGLALKEISS